MLIAMALSTAGGARAWPDEVRGPGVSCRLRSRRPSSNSTSSARCSRRFSTSSVVFFFLALFDSIGTLVGVAGRIGLARGRQFAARAPGAAGGRDRHGHRRLSRHVHRHGVRRELDGRCGRRPNRPCQRRHRRALSAGAVLPPAGQDDWRRLRGGNGVVLYPIVAPALILVGVMMMESVRRIPWDDFTEALPAFLAIVDDAAFVQHHGRHRIRFHRVCGSEAGHRPRARAQLARCTCSPRVLFRTVVTATCSGSSERTR